MSYRKLFSAAVGLAAVLLVTAAVAGPVSKDQTTPNSANMFHTTLQADFTLKTTIAEELLPAATFHKTCRCSCGFPCENDNDCGPGGLCERFISCCNLGDSSQAFQQNPARSTRTGEHPAAAGSIKCK